MMGGLADQEETMIAIWSQAGLMLPKSHQGDSGASRSCPRPVGIGCQTCLWKSVLNFGRGIVYTRFGRYERAM